MVEVDPVGDYKWFLFGGSRFLLQHFHHLQTIDFGLLRSFLIYIFVQKMLPAGFYCLPKLFPSTYFYGYEFICLQD